MHIIVEQRERIRDQIKDMKKKYEFTKQDIIEKLNRSKSKE